MKAGGRGSPRLHGEELNREVATLCFSVFEIYKSIAMKWGGLNEVVTHVEAKRGQLLIAGQRITLATSYFCRCRALPENSLEKGLEQMAEIYRDVNDVDAYQLENDQRSCHA